MDLLSGMEIQKQKQHQQGQKWEERRRRCGRTGIANRDGRIRINLGDDSQWDENNATVTAERATTATS